jgi:hypothetical protein
MIARPLESLLPNTVHAYVQREPIWLASGFLTNLTVTLTNASIRHAEGQTDTENMDDVEHKLYRAAPNDWLPAMVEYNYTSNLVFLKVTCPARDVPLIKAAFEKD